MTFNTECEIQKKTSKLGHVYFVLYVKELDKLFILSNSEAKLLTLLHKDKVSPTAVVVNND